MARITYRKTRKGETIDIRADKGEDLRNVIAAMAGPAALTADTITDEQSRDVSPRTALLRLGLDWTDVQIMTRDLLDAIAQRNRNLLNSFKD